MPKTMPIHNCPLSFVCDREWDAMAKTDRDNIRRCDLCRREVHLCADDAALEAAAEAGHCVALSVVRDPGGPRNLWEDFLYVGEPWPWGGRQGFVPPDDA